MRRTIVAALMTLGAVNAYAAGPEGTWLVEDGTAQIRIVSCGNALWGVIAWTKGAPGKDANNPDPSKRNRSVLGMPILINMKPAGDRWNGEVYNAESGQTYTSHISLSDENTLRIEGCVLGGLICGGESWTRVTPANKEKPAQAICMTLASR